MSSRKGTAGLTSKLETMGEKEDKKNKSESKPIVNEKRLSQKVAEQKASE